jgi:hypothetical protein
LKKFRTFKVAALVLTLVLALTMVGTGFALAYFPFHTTAVVGNVAEAFTLTAVSGDGSWDGSTWTVSGYPGETKSLTLNVANAGSANLVALVTSDAPVTNPGDTWVNAGSNTNLTFTWVIPSDAPIGSMTSNIYIGR